MITRGLNLDVLGLMRNRLKIVLISRITKFINLALEGFQLCKGRVHRRLNTPKMLRKKVKLGTMLKSNRTASIMGSRYLHRGQIRGTRRP